MDEGAVDEDLVGLAEAEAGGIELHRFAVLRPLLHPHPDRSVGSRRRPPARKGTAGGRQTGRWRRR